MTAQINVRSYRPQIDSHRHDFHQLVLPFCGSMELEADRGNGRVSETVAAFVLAGDAHNFWADTSSRFIVLDIPTVDAVSFAEHIPGFFFIDPALRGLLDYFRSVPTTEAHLHANWTSLLYDRLSNLTNPDERSDAVIRRALSFMQSHLGSATNVDAIARAAGVSVSGLHRIMRDRVQSTPGACLAKMRLDEAERMLSEGHLTISQIALQTGFADQSALTRAFRRERHVTPAAFRKMLSPRI